MRSALINGRVFTPHGVRSDCAVVLNESRIEALVMSGDARLRDAHVEDLPPVLAGEAAHDQLAPRALVEQAVAAQRLQSLPDRCLRDAELLCDRPLGDDAADRQLTAQDLAAEVVVRELRQGRTA